MRGTGKETETKLAIARAAPVRRRLRQLGFRLLQPRSFEHNIVFDSRRRRLRARGFLVRLRSVNGRHWLTFKGPRVFARHYKVRAESETELTNAEAAWALLAGLGLAPVFCYEKFRTVYAGRGRWRGGEAMVDETPIGNYVELEGGREWIRRVARALGARPADFITRSYAALYSDWCRRNRRPLAHMVFQGRVPRGRRFRPARTFSRQGVLEVRS